MNYLASLDHLKTTITGLEGAVADAELSADRRVGEAVRRAEAAEGERDAATAQAAEATKRADEAEAKVQAVLNALGVGISATGKPHYSSSAADDEIVKAWPALNGEFLAQEELEHRREIISALDTFAPTGVTIEEIINEAWDWGRAMSVARAQAILDRLILMYPGLIVEAQAGDYRATVPIAPRDEDGIISDDISVIDTDWEAMLDGIHAKIQAGAIEPMPEPGTEPPAPRRRRQASKAPAPAPAPNPNAGVAAMMEAAERVMKAAGTSPAPAAAEPAPADNNANDAAIMRALAEHAKVMPGDFLKVAELYSRAMYQGYTLTEGALRWRMAKGANPLAKQRADVIETQASPLAWRLRDPKPDGGDKIDQPDAPAPVEPAPDGKRPSDRDILSCLSTVEGRTYGEWEAEVERRFGWRSPNARGLESFRYEWGARCGWIKRDPLAKGKGRKPRFVLTSDIAEFDKLMAEAGK